MSDVQHSRSTLPSWKALLSVGIAVALWPPACPGEEAVRLEHVAVTYSGVGKEYAAAIARTVEAARAVAIEQFAFDMPQRISVSVRLDPKGATNLFCDGQDRLYLTVRSVRDLRKPSTSGVFQIYGMCHELGHLAMYRLIVDHGWLTTAGAEGWAHYLGSRIVDGVYGREGKDLWPDAYDYSADGTKRLERQLAAAKPSAVVRGAGLWRDLVAIVGDKGAAPVFRAWAKAAYNPADPGKALGAALAASSNDKRLAQWWTRAEPEIVFKRPKSGLAARTAKKGQLVGQPRELADDDGKAAGKKSIAGSGHAVRLEVAGNSWYLTAVRIHGSRYGYPAPPKEDFHVWLCDKDFKVIADFPFPYARFRRGPPTWVTLDVEPTNVPPAFIICVGFNPTGTKGVFVSRDGSPGEKSLVGLPGGRSAPFREGDWMIRATVDQLADANVLRSDASDHVAPAATSSRKWTDSTGRFHIEAEFLGFQDGKVRLKKTDGTVIEVPIGSLSDADQRFVRRALQKRHAR